MKVSEPLETKTGQVFTVYAESQKEIDKVVEDTEATKYKPQALKIFEGQKNKQRAVELASENATLKAEMEQMKSELEAFKQKVAPKSDKNTDK